MKKRREVEPGEDPYRAAWRRLTPAQRLKRSSRLRRRLRNPQAIHDAKTFPRF